MTRRWVFLVVLLLGACGGDPDPMDASVPDAAMQDAEPPSQCERDQDCADDTLCNGREVCRIGDAEADARGCVVEDPCLDGQTCDTEMDRCLTDCSVNRDADGDGSIAMECAGDDCDDSDGRRRPGNPEICDAEDVDEDCDARTLGGIDADGDGFVADRCCNLIDGVRTCGDDCNDASIAVNPAAEEICDLVGDNDCDPATHPFDLDMDGFDQLACGGVDCLDDEPTAFPGAPELCDGIDNNCSSGGIDDEDVDDDGHVAEGASCTGGDLPVDDCDDTEPLSFGGGAEVCDGVDNDCDSSTDEEPAASASCAEDDATMECVGGRCALLGCDDGFADCDHDFTNGCEQATTLDTSCGRCGVACGTGATCDSGVCSPIVQVVGGGFGFCALRDNGRVICWGGNEKGQLGNGSSVTESSVPVLVSGIDTAVSLAGGAEHFCAVLEDGTVSCWGDNGRGQLGNGMTGMERAPVTVLGPDSMPLAGVTEITAGGAHSCAVTTGRAFCWGAGTHGQLGNAMSEDSSIAVVVVGFASDVLVGVSGISAGFDHTCAMLFNNARCWGRNNSGQLGDGTNTDRSRLVTVSGLGSTRSVQVEAGSGFSCARNEDGEVRCWGANTVGQLGNGDDTTTAEPQLVTFPFTPEPLFGRQVTEISLGFGHSCARVSPTARPYCWGSNIFRELGDGSSSERLAPVWAQQMDDVAVEGIAVGGGATCLLRDSGQVSCWGYNQEGGLGRGTTGGPEGQAEDVASVGELVEVDGARAHTCALRSTGEVACAGNTSNAELGSGDPTFTSRALHFQGTPQPNRLVRLRTASTRTFGLGTDGSLVFWGLNFGAPGLGLGALESTTVAGIDPVADVSVGFGHTCVAFRDGTVGCRGLNDEGQLGDGTTTSGSEFTSRSLPSAAVEVACGDAHSCARTRTGEVYCWGSDEFGQLGNDAALSGTTAPAPVEGITSAVAIAAGGEHTCALLAFGEIRCWGRAAGGRLGNGATSPNQPVPVSVSGTPDTVADFVEIWAGAAHTCARRHSTGEAYCWGANADGQLGLGDTSPRSVPTSTGFPVRSGGAGDEHTCAATPIGALSCWGSAGSGRLGNGEFSGNETTPTQALLTP